MCLFPLTCTLPAWGETLDWGDNLSVSRNSTENRNTQILHFNSNNDPYCEKEYMKAFVEKHLSDALPLTSDAEVLKYGSDHVRLKGLFIELGVTAGKTINFIAALNPHQKIYDFASFAENPEDWTRDYGILITGTCGCSRPDFLPAVLHNVELIRGWFHETLPDFIQAKDIEDPIAFLHIDIDTYSSAATAFEILGPKIQPGTIIVLDEFYNYPGFEEHEFKAFSEFLESSGFEARYLAYNKYHQQVAIEILEKL
jgi:hypothetical protein